MIGGLGQISETEKSMAQINRHDDGTPLVITSDIKLSCGIGLGEDVLKKKMNNAKILGKELINNCDDL